MVLDSFVLFGYIHNLVLFDLSDGTTLSTSASTQ